MEPQIVIAGVQVALFLGGVALLMRNAPLSNELKTAVVLIFAAILGGLATYAGKNPEFNDYFSQIFLYVSLALGVVPAKLAVDKVVEYQAEKKAQERLSELRARSFHPLLDADGVFHCEGKPEECGCCSACCPHGPDKA